jgi:glucose/arabinose dehydrogenase
MACLLGLSGSIIAQAVLDTERKIMTSHHLLSASLITLLSLAACRNENSQPNATPTPENSSGTPSSAPVASQSADGVGAARHLVARPNGDVYVRLSGEVSGKCMVALRDTNQDGKADQTQPFGDKDCGSGIALDASHLYYSSQTEVWRMPLPTDALVPTGTPERIATNLGTIPQHDARSLTVDSQNHVYVTVGAPSNSCQQTDRTPGSPGQDPCPLLNEYGGVWRFNSNQKDQPKQNALRYATGIRNAVALEWNAQQNKLFLLQHGRDQLDTLFPALYNAQQSAELPAEEFVDINQGDNLGWPYCYYDPSKNLKVLAPEYGGDGSKTGRCTSFKNPLVGFPAHYAPNDLLFYSGTQFPAEYQNGAFIAFHGSWNRGTEQEGYNLVFVPFTQGKPGQWKVFADGFAGSDKITGPAQATYRPVGLTQLPDGGLLVIDSKKGRIWKITHQG